MNFKSVFHVFKTEKKVGVVDFITRTATCEGKQRRSLVQWRRDCIKQHHYKGPSFLSDG